MAAGCPKRREVGRPFGDDAGRNASRGGAGQSVRAECLVEPVVDARKGQPVFSAARDVPMAVAVRVVTADEYAVRNAMWPKRAGW